MNEITFTRSIVGVIGNVWSVCRTALLFYILADLSVPSTTRHNESNRISEFDTELREQVSIAIESLNGESMLVYDNEGTW